MLFCSIGRLEAQFASNLGARWRHAGFSDKVLNDFENLRGRTTDYIGCDNFEEEYAAVVDAMLKAANTEDWFLYYKNLTFMALRRIMPRRSEDATVIMSL